MNSNRTFTMLKPDSIEQGNMLPILNMIQDAGFNIIALKYKKMTTDEAEQFYSIHSDKPFFNDLIQFMTRGPIVAAALEKNMLNQKVRMQCMGLIVMRMRLLKLTFILKTARFLVKN